MLYLVKKKKLLYLSLSRNFQINIIIVECVNIFSSDISKERVDTSTLFFLHDAEPHVYLEPFIEDRYQLIIKSGSPFLISGAQYRDNGDYAIKDLFVKNKIVTNGYNYAGRADEQWRKDKPNTKWKILSDQAL